MCGESPRSWTFPRTPTPSSLGLDREHLCSRTFEASCIIHYIKVWHHLSQPHVATSAQLYGAEADPLWAQHTRDTGHYHCVQHHCQQQDRSWGMCIMMDQVLHKFVTKSYFKSDIEMIHVFDELFILSLLRKWSDDVIKTQISSYNPNRFDL